MIHERLQVIIDIIALPCFVGFLVYLLMCIFGHKKTFGMQVDENTKRIDKLEKRLDRLENDKE